MWSFYFMLLEFLGEQLVWRQAAKLTISDVKKIKEKCLEDPENNLWFLTKKYEEVKNIFRSIKALQFKDKPNYAYIRSQLSQILASQIQRDNAELQKMIKPEQIYAP